MTTGPTTCCSVAIGSWSSTGRRSGSVPAPPTSATCSAPASSRTTRREHEAALVDRYVAGLARQGVDVDRDAIWDGYRRYAFGGLIMAIVASALVRRTDRGDEMFLTMAQRHAHQGLELDTEALYPRRE